MPRHKHADVIIAWANGETVQQFDGEDGDTTYWVEWNNACGITPAFDYGRWRIKPKIVRREGWVNVYSYGEHFDCFPYNTKEEADMNAGQKVRQACIRIEWEEEE